MNRRELLLTTAAASAAAISFDTHAAHEQAGIVDVHAHVVPAAYAEFLKSQGVLAIPKFPHANTPHPLSNPGDSAESISARLREMDDAGVQTQILSMPIMPFFNEKSVAIQAAKIGNESMLAVADRAPDRFRVFVVLPMPHLDEAQQQLTHLLSHPSVAGVGLNCFYGDRSAADPYFEPLYAALDRAGVVAFFHPVVNGLCSRFINDWDLAGTAGPTFEDSLIAIHLMLTGLPLRYPRIRFIVPHLAGGLSTLVKRLNNQLPLFKTLAEPPTQTAKRLWYDTVCHGSAAAMHAAIEAFGADRILPGSDWPTLTLHETYRETFSFIREIGLPANTVEAILNENALRLFGSLLPSKSRSA